MNFNINVLVVVFLSFLLANGACAANKTGVTDLLSAGDSRVDLDYIYLGATNNGRSTSATSSLEYSGKPTASRLGATYLFGVTDRLNMGVLLGFSKSIGETSVTSRIICRINYAKLSPSFSTWRGVSNEALQSDAAGG